MVIMKQFLTRYLHYLLVIWSILLINLGTNVYAATLSASVSKNRIAKNEVFELHIITDQKVNADSIDFSVLNRDFLVSQPGFSTSINIINGKQSSYSEWNLALAATRVGTLVIPSFKLNGEQTQPITLNVSADSQAPDTHDLLEMQNKLDQDSLYVGESTLLHMTLLIKADIRRLQNPQLLAPVAENLKIEPVDEGRQYQQVQNGIQVTIINQSFRITAEKAGQFTLTAPKFTSGLIYHDRSASNPRVTSLSSPNKEYPLTILPPLADYLGFWLPTRQLTLTQTWQNSDARLVERPDVELRVGDAITRQIQLQVSGLSSEQLPDLQIHYPDTVRIYSDKPAFTNTSNGDVIMTVKQVIIPKQTGTIQLPAVSVTWWNSGKKTAETSQVAGLILNVVAGEPVATGTTLPIPTPAVTSCTPITITSASYWPYITAFLAVLWLLTLIYALRLRAYTTVKKSNESEKKPQHHHAYRAVEEALASQDGIRIQRAIKHWLNHVNLTPAEQAELKNTLDPLQQAWYGKQLQTVDIQPLTLLIQRLQQQQRKYRQHDQTPLAKL